MQLFPYIYKIVQRSSQQFKNSNRNNESGHNLMRITLSQSFKPSPPSSRITITLHYNDYVIMGTNKHAKMMFSLLS
jgi:hypothetical protein